MTPRPIVFLHIPKTAGTSLIELVGRGFGAHEICRIEDIHRPVDEIAGDVEVAIAEGKRFICGHFPYAAISHLRGEVDVFTLLREPVARIVSLYRFWRGQDDAGASQASRFACHLARALSFEDFLDCDHPLITSATRDEMSKALAGKRSQTQDDPDPAELLQDARASLSGMAFGLVEDMGRSQRLLSRRLGLNLLDGVRLNSGDHLPAAVPGDRLRERILAGNVADFMLHRHASEQFEREMRRFDMEVLFDQIGERALTPMHPDDRGQFHWDASMPVAGIGWNDRECLPDGPFYRFTSSPESVVYLPAPFGSGPFTIAIDVLFFNREGLLGPDGPVRNDRALRFELDGAPVDFHACPLGEGGETFTINVDANRAARAFTTLAIRSRHGLSPSLFGSPDRRTVAAAVAAIRLGR